MSAARQVLYGRAVWGAFGLSSPWTATPTYTVPLTLIGVMGAENQTASKDTKMAKQRILTLNPSRAKAAYYRACAFAALHADSSLSVRLRRYNAAMDKARALEVTEATE